MPKRTDYISWDEYFMGIALLSAQRSKDPTRQVGACIVNKNKKIVGIGYNGLPRGCDDDLFPREKHDHLEHSKYGYVCHAELNAILNSPEDLSGCTMYVTLMPCNECTKALIQSWIEEVVYLSDTHKYRAWTIAAKRMMDHVGIKYRQADIENKTLTISFEETPPHPHEKPEN